MSHYIPRDYCFGQAESNTPECARPVGSGTIEFAGRTACQRCIEIFTSNQAKEIKKLKAQARKHEYDATHDQLTGLPNRRALQPAYQELRASGKPFGLLLIDVVNFKPINDKNGHSGGDAMLKYVADIVQQRIRSGETDRRSDIDTLMSFSRHGGDEFVILAPLTGEEGGQTSDERLEAMKAGIIDHFARQPEVLLTNAHSDPHQQIGLRISGALYDAALARRPTLDGMLSEAGVKFPHRPDAISNPGIESIAARY